MWDVEEEVAGEKNGDQEELVAKEFAHEEVADAEEVDQEDLVAHVADHGLDAVLDGPTRRRIIPLWRYPVGLNGIR